MLIRITKKTDGGAALSCTRSDGTVTWQQPLPHEARAVEQVVGFLDTERASGREWTAADLRLARPYAFGEEELRQVRDARRDLFARWVALAAGDSLELPFVPRQRSA